MKFALFALAIVASFGLSAKADEPIYGSFNTPDQHPAEDGLPIYSDFYFRVSYGGVGGLDSIFQFSPDLRTADFLCKQFTQHRDSKALSLDTKKTLFSKPVVSIVKDEGGASQPVTTASKSNVYLNQVKCMHSSID